MQCFIIMSEVNLPDLELLRVPVDDLPLEGVDEGVRVKEDRSLRKINLALPHRLQVLLGHACLADSSGREVHDMVAVGADLREQLRHSRLSPVTSDHGKKLAENIRFCDRSIDV